jgi:hypothetical protein
MLERNIIYLSLIFTSSEKRKSHTMELNRGTFDDFIFYLMGYLSENLFKPFFKQKQIIRLSNII